MKSLSYFAAIALPALVLASCKHNSQIQEPDDYSPGYSYVATGEGSQKGADSSMLVPDACLAAPADGRTKAETRVTIVKDLGEHLPPGCANAYNLQRMAESQRDLVEGRRMGPAHGAPTARAARKYLYGEDGPAPTVPEETTGN